MEVESVRGFSKMTQERFMPQVDGLRLIAVGSAVLVHLHDALCRAGAI
jgi:peptidoglycan/LPS O-acetylase OafA/YrhL